MKNYPDNLLSIKNAEDLNLEKMFDKSEKLISEQSDEIYGISTINWEHSSSKYVSLTDAEQVISLQRTKVHIFPDIGKVNENPQSNLALEDRLTWFKSSKEYRRETLSIRLVAFSRTQRIRESVILWESSLAGLVFGFHSSHVVMCGLYIWDPWIWFLRLQKRWTMHHACPKNFAAHCWGSAFQDNVLTFQWDLDELGTTQVNW